MKSKHIAPFVTLAQLLVLVLGQNDNSGGNSAGQPNIPTTTTTFSTTTTTASTTTTLPPSFVTTRRKQVREGWASETKISEYVLPGRKVEFFDPCNSKKILVVFRYSFCAPRKVVFWASFVSIQNIFSTLFLNCPTWLLHFRQNRSSDKN